VSYVTNLIFSLSIVDVDRGKMDEVNTYFVDKGIKPLVSVDDERLPRAWYGGSKYLETGLYLGAFNHLNLDDFIKHVRTISWEFPESVQIIVKEQEDLKFTIIDLDLMAQNPM
jgi:hypothetical protein